MVELHPEALRKAVFDAIRPFYDANLDARVGEAEEKWRKEAHEALRSHPDYEGICERITSAWKMVRDAVGELHSEQQRATAILQDSLLAPPELPEAAPSGEAMPALFDSDTDFIAATRRLIDRKKLIG